MDCSSFLDFEAKYGANTAEDVLNRITDAQYDKTGAGDHGVTVLDIYKHNACNITMSGTITVGLETFAFVYDSGDWNGSVMRKWGDPEKIGPYVPEPHVPLTFVPRDRTLRLKSPGLWKVYLMWRREEWFVEKERGYNYDRFFQPGSVTEKHYREWAAKKGMVVGYLSDLDLTPQEMEYLKNKSISVLE